MGTTFVIKSSARNTLITADHTITDNFAIANWFIIEEVGRNIYGKWIFDPNKLIAVTVKDRDSDNDVAILEAQCIFDEKDMILYALGLKRIIVPLEIVCLITNVRC